MKCRTKIAAFLAVFAVLLSAALFVGCETHSYTVSFQSNGGTRLAPVIYREGGEAVSLPIPERPDYLFAGWFDNERLEGNPIEDGYIPNKDVTLYAAWTAERKETEVSFDSRGGTTHAPIVYTGENALVLPEPFRYKYEFGGWFDNETCTGEPISGNYIPAKDITLYAKWIPCTYLYLYGGKDGLEPERITYFEGDTIAVDRLTAEDIIVEGVTCAFLRWTYEDGTVPPDTLTVGEENIILVAEYDLSGLPAKKYLTDNGNGTFTATGNVVWAFESHAEEINVYSATVRIAKGASGGAGIAFRITLSGNDYAFQDVGTSYLSAVIAPSTGHLQVASVTDGVFAHMKGSVVALSSMPRAWQDKYGSADDIYTVLTVADYGNRFEIYVDGDLAYTFDDSGFLSAYTGEGLGIRCSTKGAEFGDFIYRNGEITISFDTNGGTECSPVSWLCGTALLPEPYKEGLVLEGWYYDGELLNRADPKNIIAAEDIVLYAKWTDDFFTVSFDGKGGSEAQDVYYTGGTLVLPVPQRKNYVFTGWYYETECVNAVDPLSPEIDGDVTLYAGWRLPSGAVTDNGDGTFTAVGRTAVLSGIGESLYSEISINVSFVKGSGGAVGILFRASLSGDNAFEADCHYLSVQIAPANGRMQVSAVTNGQWAHLAGSLPAFNTMPSEWQEKYNAAQTDEIVTAVITVKCYKDRFEAYIDGKFVMEFDDAQKLAEFTDTGYGLRSTSNGSVFSVEYKEIYLAEYVVKGETVKTAYFDEGTVYTLENLVGDGVISEDDSGYYVDRFDGWYTEENGGERVTETAVSRTVFARFVRDSVTADVAKITFSVDGKTISTSLIYKNGKTEFPADPIKNSVTLPNGNITTYSFEGWYVGGVEVTSDAIFDQDAVVNAKFAEKTTRNTYTVIENENGLDGYEITTDANTTQGFTVPGVEMEAGEFSYDITYTKGTAAYNFRTIFFVQDNGTLKFDGAGTDGGQGSIFLNFQMNSGTLILGRKIGSKYRETSVTQSCNSYEQSFGALSANCPYKIKFNSAAVGEELTLTFKVVFRKGGVKIYVEDSLLFVYGDMDYSGETLYGKLCTGDNLHASDGGLFAGWMSEPKGTKVGFHPWSAISAVGGKIVISNIRCTESAAETQTDAADVTDTQDLFIVKKEEL